MAGRVILITGAGGEIGTTLSAALPKVGDTVYLGGRSREKMAELAGTVGREGVRYVPFEIDLASLESIRRAAEELKAETDRLDLLMANAGIMAIERTVTADGFEAQFGVCHLGHFALTAHLLPLLKETPGARVVTTSSSAAWFGNIIFDDLMGERRYKRYDAYCQAKLANVLFAFELNRRFSKAGIAATANSAHPGFVYGNLQEQALRSAGFFEKVIYRTVVKHLVSQSPQQGVEPLLLAAGPQGEGGAMYGPRWFSRGAGIKVKPPKRSLDEALAARLWAVSEKLTGLSLGI